MDVLSSVMQSVRLNGAVFFSVAASPPLIAHTPNMRDIAGRVMPAAAHVIPFHIMLQGACWVETTDREEPPVRFGPGDIVLYPRGDGHIFVTRLGDRLPPDIDVYKRPDSGRLPIMMRLGDEAAPELRFVCGYLGCDAGPFNPLIEALPSRIHAACQPEGAHIEVGLIHEAVEESATHREGGEAILARLSELLFVRVLRRYVAELPDDAAGWFAGLRDPQLRAALALIHAQPERDWSLADLARQCGMSRAAFAERFATCVGQTPMRYLARWRMQVASGLLRDGRLSIEAVAEEVGYHSQASFTRAFKSFVGAPPGVWRRREDATEAPTWA